MKKSILLSLAFSISAMFVNGQTNFINGFPIKIDAALQQKLSSKFRTYKVFEINTQALFNEAKKATTKKEHTISMTFIPSQKWNIVIQPNIITAPNYKSVVTTDLGEIEMPNEANTYKGHIENHEKSVVRLTIANGFVKGYIIDNDQMYYLENLSNYQKTASENSLIMYSPEDVKNTSFVCGLEETQHSSNKVQNNMHNTSGGAIIKFEMATDADYEYWLKYGNNANNHILSILNEVEGKYYANFAIVFSVTFQNVYATSNDPYTSTNSLDLLNEFKNYWNSNRTNIRKDFTHLWTGKNLDGSIIGLAFLSQICGPSAYGLSQDWDSGPYGTFVLTAHEIGHNFGSNHEDGENCSGNGSIMCEFAQTNSYYFSAAEKGRITAFISGLIQSQPSWPAPPYSCVEPVICVDTYTLTDEISSGTHEYVANTSITASNKIKSGSTVIFDAGSEIVLLPGFEVEAGAEFTAFIDGCTLIENPNARIDFKKDENADYSTVSEKETTTNLSNTIVPNYRLNVFPNPTNEIKTTIKYSLEKNSNANITLVNTFGEEVIKIIDNQMLNQGNHEVQFDISNLKTGVYYILFSTDLYLETKKLVVFH